MLPVAFGVFGLIVGSFLNVCILRKGIRSLRGRSACLSCNATLQWYELVPLLSWILLRGRCLSCKKPISIQYPLVEGATGILFALLGAAYVPLLFIEETAALSLLGLLISLAIASTLTMIAVYDMLHTIIPDEWVWAFNALAFGSIFLFPPYPIPHILYAILAGPLAALPLFALWLVSKGAWMGFGDVKLALGIGWLLGPIFGILAIFFSFILGAAISILILLPLPYLLRALPGRGIARLSAGDARFTMKSEIPFGPFLILSCLVFWFASLYGIPIPLPL